MERTASNAVASSNITTKQAAPLSTRLHSDQKAPVEKIHALTSLRFFAALYVVLYHTLWFAIPSLTHASPGGRVLSLGYLSVGFFFLLSGYILSIVYLHEGQSISKRAFYIARFARVYPLFFLTLVAGTPFLLLSRIHQYGLNSAIAKTTVSFVGHLFMLQAWIPVLRGIDNPNWSLSVETLFYAIFPFLGVIIWRFRKRSHVVIAGAVVYILSQLLVNLAFPHVPTSVAELNPVLHLGTFTMGILLARWHVLYRGEHGHSPKNSFTSGMVLFLAAVAFAGVVAWEPRPPLAKLADGLLAPLSMAVIWALSNNHSVFSRWLSAPWLVVLGEASYGLYLIHYIAYQLFTAIGGEKNPALFWLYLSGSIGLSVLSLYYFETPARKWLLKRLRTRPKETLEAASDAQ